MITRWIFAIVEVFCIIFAIVLTYFLINNPDGNARTWLIIDGVIFVVAVIVLCILETFVFESDEDERRDVYGTFPAAAG